MITPRDSAAPPARLPLQFGLVKILIALHLLAAAANAGELVYNRTPSVLGFLATVLLGAGWVGIAWLKGREGSRRFGPIAGAVWLALLVAFAAAQWAVTGAQGAEIPGGVVTIAVLFVTGGPFHGIAGFLGLPQALRYVAVMVGLAALTAAAFVVTPRETP